MQTIDKFAVWIGSATGVRGSETDRDVDDASTRLLRFGRHGVVLERCGIDWRPWACARNELVEALLDGGAALPSDIVDAVVRVEGRNPKADG